MLLAKLQQEVGDFSLPIFCSLPPLPADIISSSFQKGLRRGLLTAALPAAEALLRHDPAHFWRRFITIVFEDFGVSDLVLTRQIVAAGQHRPWRQKDDLSLRAAAYFITRLCQTPTDRRLDDLYMLAHACLKSKAFQSKVDASSKSIQSLVEEAKRISLLCERTVPRRSFYALNVKACESYMQRWWGNEDLLSLTRAGRRLSACLLPLLLPLWLKVSGGQASFPARINRRNTNNQLIHGVLVEAVDGYTLLGRKLLGRLINKSSPLYRRLSRNGWRPTLRTAAMLLFVLEGGALSLSLEDAVSREIGELAKGCWTGLPPDLIPLALSTMEDVLPEFRRCRQEVVSERLSASVIQQGGAL